MIRNILKRLKQKRCKHSWFITSSQETGKMCFSFNCARPQTLVAEKCCLCGLEKSGHYMSGDPEKAIPMTPDVARVLLRHEFGHD